MKDTLLGVMLGVCYFAFGIGVAHVTAQFISGSLLTGTATVVTITAPTSSSTYDAGTSSELTTLAGTSSASDRVVSLCTWTNSLGGSGTATGTTSWSVSSIALTVGSNLITVTCTNAGGGIGTDTLTVTRTSGSLTGYFVDSSCAFNGTGTTDACAASGGAAGAFLDPQSCFTAVSTSTFTNCYIKNGSGIYTRDQVDGGYRDQSGYYPTHSGTSSNKLTIQNYPGHTPTLRNCTTYLTSECAGATITTNGHSYIRIIGLTIIGALHLHNSAPTTSACTGCTVGWEVAYNTVSVGWFADGNWSGIYAEAHSGLWVHHNLTQDILNHSYGDPGESHIKYYHVVDSITEYNTMLGEGYEETGLDDKENGNRNITRYNYADNLSGAAYQFCFYAVTPFDICEDNEVYGNIAINAGNLVTVQGGSGGGSATNTDVYNNTGRNILVFGEQRSDGNLINYRRWNNVLVATIDNDYMYNPGESPDFSDYNIWTSGQGFDFGGTGYANLAALKSGGGTLDDNSTDTAPTFVSSTDHHLTGAGLTFCRVGGTSAGAVVSCGAYGVTSCVGHSCS